MKNYSINHHRTALEIKATTTVVVMIFKYIKLIDLYITNDDFSKTKNAVGVWRIKEKK